MNYTILIVHVEKFIISYKQYEETDYETYWYLTIQKHKRHPNKFSINSKAKVQQR